MEKMASTRVNPSPFDLKKIDFFPSGPGVYLMKNGNKEVIYVGKAKELKKRVKQYFTSGQDERPMIPFLIEEIAFIDTIVVNSEKEALLLENTLIKKHQPKFNILLKDDKSFISIMINYKHPWPMAKIVRYKGRPKKDGHYFGPYTSAYAARQVLDLLQRLFPMRQCSDEELKRRTRPCLLYSIKRCVAPCVQKCSKDEYQSFVQGAVQFLKGKDNEIVKNLKEEMEKASDALEFEKAGAFLETIRQIEHVTEKKPIIYKTFGKDSDVLGIYRSGTDVLLAQLIIREGKLTGCEHYLFSEVMEEDSDLICSFLLQHYEKSQFFPEEILVPSPLKEKEDLEEILSEMKHKKVHISYSSKGEKKKLLELAEENAKSIYLREKSEDERREQILLEMQELFSLNRYPEKIECFDISHLSGSDLVASAVAYTDGKKDSKRKKLFLIRGIDKGDDYGALHQALSRHLFKAKEKNDLPDLLLIDGGKGQLHIAEEVLQELDIASVDLLSITKEEGRHDKGMTKERVFIPDQKEPISLDFKSPVLFFLQKIRDEAHRSVLQFHEKRRTKRLLTSSLDSLSGIGPIKKKKLLKHFGSVKKIQEADIEELEKVEGLSKKDIQILLSFQTKEKK